MRLVGVSLRDVSVMDVPSTVIPRSSVDGGASRCLSTATSRSLVLVKPGMTGVGDVSEKEQSERMAKRSPNPQRSALLRKSRKHGPLRFAPYLYFIGAPLSGPSGGDCTLPRSPDLLVVEQLYSVEV
jgi:hypothetical protein